MIINILVNPTKKASAIERLKARGEEVNEVNVEAEYLRLGGKIRQDEIPDPVKEVKKEEAIVVKPQEDKQKKHAKVIKKSN